MLKTVEEILQGWKEEQASCPEPGTSRTCKGCKKDLPATDGFPGEWCAECLEVQEKRRLEISLRQRCNLPPRVFDFSKSFAQGHPANALSDTWEKRCEENGALLLSGPMGVGKSAWACSRLVETASSKPQFEGRFESMLSLIRSVRQTWRSSETSEDVVMARFFNMHLLVVDDVGVQMGSDNERNILYEILMHRYNHFLPTILTTNLNPAKPEGKDALIRCLGNQLYDRLIPGLVDCSTWPRARGKA